MDELLNDPLGAASLKQLAARHAVSREHLIRCFARRVGRPPAAYVAERRRHCAIDLICQTTRPMAAIAKQAGYASAHTMARQLRGATGRPPSALRRGG
ncbi:MAG: helix-turn-helix domain-containing protein [Alphaproteobacteria bacterium]|nr:helix-turn-helix domain-containing protein [Alphaproteobacteria bacterium]